MASQKKIIITIVGAESSGKTTLAQHLVKHFNCLHVPEFAREYLTSLGRPYSKDDLKIIAKNELKIIDKVLKGESNILHEKIIVNNMSTHQSSVAEQQGLLEMLTSLSPDSTSMVIIDGGMLTLRMWAKIKYKNKIEVVETALNNDITDIYLLCRPRKEWEPDALREAPDLIERAWIYNLYLQELMKMDARFEIVTV